MRIVLCGESYLPYLSGVTVSTATLARGLGARGHQVLLVAPRPARGAEPGSGGAPGPEPAQAWLPSYQLPWGAPHGYRMPWPMPWPAAMQEAERFTPDIVHAQSPFVSGLLARRLAHRCRAPLVFTHHTRFADYGHYLGPLATPGAALAEAYLRRFWLGCAAVIAPSSDMAAEIRGRLGARSRPLVRAIPTGVDVAGIATLAAVDPRPLAGWAAETVVAVTLGRLAPEKSLEVVLDAAALAAAREPRLRLLVIGDGPSAEALRKRAAAPDLAGRVHLSGALSRIAALALAKGGDLLAFASQTETQGLVLAEALACGLPVVAVDAPGVRDSVRDGLDGILVAAEPPEERPGRLAEAMVTVGGDAVRRAALRRRALADAARFDVGGRVGEVEALYQEVLATGRT